jgi:hypothetical protein
VRPYRVIPDALSRIQVVFATLKDVPWGNIRKEDLYV